MDPANESHKSVIWAKCKQHEIDAKFMDSVVELFSDKRGQSGAPDAAGKSDIIKVTGP